MTSAPQAMETMHIHLHCARRNAAVLRPAVSAAVTPSFAGTAAPPGAVATDRDGLGHILDADLVRDRATGAA